MQIPERFRALPDYAFPRLRSLLDAHPAGGETIHMSIGEPRHDPPPWVVDVIAENAGDFRKYPPNEGTPALREAISGWIGRRYGVAVDPEREVVSLNGTREGLFNAVLALCPGGAPNVLVPNPFYQAYAAAALAAEATPVYVPATRQTGFLPDFGAVPADVLDRTAIAFICSPSNPQGAIANAGYWRALIALAERHDFRIFADECYSEIYRDTPPVGALQVAREMGADAERVVIFHSLSKRSNLAGLRVGFAAGGPETVGALKRLRAYGGAPVPLPLQAVAARAWNEETHVEASRRRYVGKYDIVDEVLAGVEGCAAPDAGFFLWLPVEDGETAALELWRRTGVRVLPGSYLSREVDGENPGRGYIRVALVADEDEMRRGLERIRDCIYT